MECLWIFFIFSSSPLPCVPKLFFCFSPDPITVYSLRPTTWLLSLTASGYCLNTGYRILPRFWENCQPYQLKSQKEMLSFWNCWNQWARWSLVSLDTVTFIFQWNFSLPALSTAKQILALRISERILNLWTLIMH